MNKLAAITAMRAADGGAHLLLEIEIKSADGVKKECLSLLSSRLRTLPRVGELDADTLAYLHGEAQICAAIETGLRSLGANGCSKRALLQKLRTRGFSTDAAQAAIKELSEKGFLREEESALREAERGLSKLWGDQRILADLRAKGYESGAIGYAAARLRCEDSVSRLRRLLQKKRLLPCATDREAQKLIASLLRYGYTAQEIRKALSK